MNAHTSIQVTDYPFRSPHLTDLDVVARCLAGADDLPQVIRVVIGRAIIADRHRIETGKAHYPFGSGNIQDAARSMHRPADIAAQNAGYLKAISMLCDVLADIGDLYPTEIEAFVKDAQEYAADRQVAA